MARDGDVMVIGRISRACEADKDGCGSLKKHIG